MRRPGFASSTARDRPSPSTNRIPGLPVGTKEERRLATFGGARVATDRAGAAADVAQQLQLAANYVSYYAQSVAAQVTYQQELQDDVLAAGAEAKRDAALLALDLAQIENTANADYQYAQTLAAGLQTYGDASIQADYGYSVQMAGAIYAANQADAQSEMTLSLGLAAASDLATAETNTAVNEVTRRLAVNDAQHDSNVAAAQLTGVTTINGLLDSDYTAFLVAKFTGQQSAAANLVAETTDWALDNIAANVAYAALAATAESVYVNLRETTIFAHQLLAATSEKLNEDQIAASYQANGTQLSAAIAAYQTAEAAALRDHRIAVEQADRRLTADGDQTAHDAAVAAADQALADAKTAFTSAYYAAAISAEGDYQADVAQADAQYVNNVGQSRIRAAQAIADASVDYVTTEAGANRTQQESIAARDEQFAQFGADEEYDSLVDALAALTNDNGGTADPWTTKNLAVAEAVHDAALAVAGGINDYQNENAVAEEARSVAEAEVGRDRKLKEVAAEVREIAAQAEVNADKKKDAYYALEGSSAPLLVRLNVTANGADSDGSGLRNAQSVHQPPPELTQPFTLSHIGLDQIDITLLPTESPVDPELEWIKSYLANSQQEIQQEIQDELIRKEVESQRAARWEEHWRVLNSNLYESPPPTLFDKIVSLHAGPSKPPEMPWDYERRLHQQKVDALRETIHEYGAVGSVLASGYYTVSGLGQKVSYVVRIIPYSDGLFAIADDGHAIWGEALYGTRTEDADTLGSIAYDLTGDTASMGEAAERLQAIAGKIMDGDLNASRAVGDEFQVVAVVAGEGAFFLGAQGGAGLGAVRLTPNLIAGDSAFAMSQLGGRQLLYAQAYGLAKAAGSRVSEETGQLEAINDTLVNLQHELQRHPEIMLGVQLHLDQMRYASGQFAPAKKGAFGADDVIRLGQNGQLELHPSVYDFDTPIVAQDGLAVRYHYSPTAAIDGILESGVLRATDTGPPLTGTPKAWVTTITPQQMSGSLAWAHRLRLGFSPSSKIPTPHIRNGMLVFQREDGWIQILTPVDNLQRAPWWKAPFGGQEYYPGDIFVMPNAPTGGI